MAAISWLTSHVDASAWERRLESTRDLFQNAQSQWARGDRVPLHDADDGIAWYLFQSDAYANSRASRNQWYEPDGYRIAPVVRRIGELLPCLQEVEGIEGRVARLMTDGRSVPDNGLYELLVAGAYASRGWKVAFVPERPGRAKTQDLFVESGRRRWAVECKRVTRTGYEHAEFEQGQGLAAAAHDVCAEKSASLVIEVIFTSELSQIPSDYLAEKVERAIRTKRVVRWSDSFGRGQIRSVLWEAMQAVLSCDDVFFGSSRMVELLAGTYAPNFDHSIRGDWVAARSLPFHATSVSRISLVSWRSDSVEAMKRKATHFRSLVARAERQLQPDLPGCVHVGYEAIGGNSVDAARHIFNSMEMSQFEPSARLRWVYGNFMMPEHVTKKMESLALQETTAAYMIGQGRTAEPLPNHLLFVDGNGRDGSHWL